MPDVKHVFIPHKSIYLRFKSALLSPISASLCIKSAYSVLKTALSNLKSQDHEAVIKGYKKKIPQQFFSNFHPFFFSFLQLMTQMILAGFTENSNSLKVHDMNFLKVFFF